ASEIVTFDVSSASADLNGLTEFSNAYLSAGSEGVTDYQDYANAIQALADYDPVAVVIGTGDEGILTDAKAFAEQQPDNKNRKECIVYTGPNKQASKQALLDAVKVLAPGLSSSRVAIVAGEPKLIDNTTGSLKVFPSYYAAAMVAGLKAGNRPEISPTN